VFWHGDWATRGFYALRLGDMPIEQPIFLAHPYPNPDPGLTIEEMARAYLPRLLSMHPTGGLRLAGLCNGGIFAWEVAHQLERLGREVELIVLIDVISLNARPLFRALALLNKLVIALAPKKISRKFVGGGVMRRIRQWAKQLPSYGLYSRAISNYIPPKIKSRVVCIVCHESCARREYAWRPWANLAEQVYFERVPGTHQSCVTTHFGEVVRALHRFIN
jgi:thioesterase domain-containing protein